MYILDFGRQVSFNFETIKDAIIKKEKDGNISSVSVLRTLGMEEEKVVKPTVSDGDIGNYYGHTDNISIIDSDHFSKWVSSSIVYPNGIRMDEKLILELKKFKEGRNLLKCFKDIYRDNENYPNKETVFILNKSFLKSIKDVYDYSIENLDELPIGVLEFIKHIVFWSLKTIRHNGIQSCIRFSKA